MNKLIKQLFLFFIILLGILVVFEVVTTRVKQNSHAYPAENEVWNDIYKTEINADILIYGSSRAWVHFDPAIISSINSKSCYNLGIDGSNFAQQYVRHREYLKHNNKPEVIIMSVDVFTFKKRDFNNKPDKQIAPYVFGNTSLLKYPDIGYGFVDAFVPFIRYSKAYTFYSLFKHTNDIDSNYRVNGYRGMELPWGSTPTGKITNELKPFSVDIDSSLTLLFEKFIQECSANNIKIILVSAPEFEPGHFLIENRDEIFDIFNRYAKKYDLLFWNYSNHSISKNKSLFYNYTHMNITGAALFSNEIGLRLKMNF